MNSWDRGYWQVNPLVNNQRQENLPYSCACAPGFYGDNCETTTLPTTVYPTCASSPPYCSNGATCIDHFPVPTCYCMCGYSGDQCEISATTLTRGATSMLQDFCSSQGDVCFNGGSCFNDAQGQTFFCNCQAGFWGTRCQNAGKSAASAALPSLLIAVLSIAMALKAKF